MSGEEKGWTIVGVAVVLFFITCILCWHLYAVVQSDNNKAVGIAKAHACQSATSVDGCLATIKKGG